MSVEPTPARSDKPPMPMSNTRTAVMAVTEKNFSLSDGFNRDARAFRNRLVVMSLIALATSITLVFLQWRLPQAAIVQAPKGSSGVSRWALMLLVMAFGSIGSLISTIPALAAIPRVKSPYNFPLQQALLKVVLGSLTALVGVIVTGSAGVTSGFGSLQALIGIAVVFGAAQQAVTQYLDRRAGQIISAAPPSTS
jgi:hypothetical protein